MIIWGDYMADERVLGPLSRGVRECGAEPPIEEMERRSLAKKGIEGPTSAHAIEEIHTPLNIACVTFSTGTSAFQNPVCITYQELEERVKAGRQALKLAGVKKGDRLLVTYPPLVNVFTKRALSEAFVSVSFLHRSSRDSCLAALCEETYQAVIGESKFLRSVLDMASVLGVEGQLNRDLTVIAAGSALDPGLLEKTRELGIHCVHDLYGCQEFGWLSLDGALLREDVALVEWEGENHVFVGGLAVGDSFPVCQKKHILNQNGTLLSCYMTRSAVEWETILFQSVVRERETAVRAARTVLRLKSKVVRVAGQLKAGCPCNIVKVCPVMGDKVLASLPYEGSTKMLDDILEAQIQYQKNGKADPVWKKW